MDTANERSLRLGVAAVVCGLCVLGGCAHAQAGGEADADAGVVEFVLSPDSWAAQAVTVAPGRVTTLSFFDENDRPLSIAGLLGPRDDWLEYGAQDRAHDHVAILLARRAGAGNVVALLDGVDRPVHIEVAAGDSPSASQVEIRIARPAAARQAARRKGGAGSAPPRGELADAIRDYLLDNPDVLREALDPARQLVATAERMRDEILGAAGVPADGEEAAPVTVVEFFDYRCGFCKRSLDAVRMALQRPDVRLEMREYPILGDDSTRAAQAALAAARQGRYLDAHWALMEHDGGYDDATIKRIAADLGLDEERLLADMDSPEVAALIEANRTLARKLGVSGTPAFLVAGPEAFEVSPGALDAERLGRLIDAVGG